MPPHTTHGFRARNTLLAGLFLAFCAHTAFADQDSCLAWWSFDGESQIGKDASGHGFDLKVSGNPTIRDNALLLSGGKISERKSEAEYLALPEHVPAFDFKGQSFTVECRVKTRGVGYYQFIGTRVCLRNAYTDIPGWALGMSREGVINFVLNDTGTQRSCAGIHFLKCDWDLHGWNHVAAVRDVEHKTLTLYVNGKAAAEAKDTTDDISSPNVLSVGKDAYTDSLLAGELRELRITPSALHAELVKDACDFLLDLQPAPKKMTVGSVIVPLRAPVRLKSPQEPTPVQMTAVAMLAERLAALGVKMEPATTNGGEQPEGSTIEFTSASSELPAGGYELRVQEMDGRLRITIGSKDEGSIYGALTLFDVIQKTTAYREFAPSIPRNLEIVDHPSIKNRIEVRIFESDLKESDEALRKGLRWIAANRFNIYMHGLEKLTDENAARLARIAAECGISLMAPISFAGESRKLGRGLSPLNKEDVERINTYFDRAGKAGYTYFTFMFDDAEEYNGAVKADPECSRIFGDDVGNLHKALIQIMLDVGAKYDVKEYVVCPSPYMHNWENSAKTWWGRGGVKYDDYFKKISDFPATDRLRAFHCEFSQEEVKRLQEVGLKNYAYFVNGLWSTDQWFTWYAGPTRLHWTWYGFAIDDEKGPVFEPDAMSGFRKIDMLTDTVLLGACGGFTTLLAGIWLWNPEKFDEERARRDCLTRGVLDNGIYEDFAKYERAMLPLIGYFKAHMTTWTAECHPRIIAQPERPAHEVLRERWGNVRSAEQAMASLKTKAAAETRPVPASIMAETVKPELAKMEKTLAVAREKLTFLMRKYGIDTAQ